MGAMNWKPLVAGAFAAGLSFLVPTASASSSPPAASTTQPCGVSSTTPNYTHVVWILLENEGYSVVGSPSAPYLNALANRCGLATNYLAISHPSLPNYIALTSGSTHGITDDGEPDEHPVSGPSIFSQLDGNWRGLDQSMPSNCDTVTTDSYAARHNPAVYYTSLRSACAHDDVPLSIPLDLSTKFTFITPNICDDMHSCPISIGDRWLSQIVPSIIASPEYRSHSLVLFITFDENDTGPTNRVPTYVVAPSVPRGLRVSAPLNHYSLLRGTESLLGLSYLGAAGSATNLLAPFHL
jgi:phosphatidylinositol-3-phosphatase